jgi:uncharacterized protein with von Willebrand factor type A (vWA) domain
MRRRKTPQEVIEYAKKLYLTIDENGKRVYSLSEIAKKLDEKFAVKLTKETIRQWANKFQWNRLLSQAIVVSGCDKETQEKMEATITQVVEELPVDEELIEKIARVKRSVLMQHLEMARKLYQAVKERDPNDKRFPRLCEVANQVGKAIYEMLSEVEETETEEENFPAKIIIREIRVEKE